MDKHNFPSKKVETWNKQGHHIAGTETVMHKLGQLVHLSSWWQDMCLFHLQADQKSCQVLFGIFFKALQPTELHSPNQNHSSIHRVLRSLDLIPLLVGEVVERHCHALRGALKLQGSLNSSTSSGFKTLLKICFDFFSQGWFLNSIQKLHKTWWTNQVCAFNLRLQSTFHTVQQLWPRGLGGNELHVIDLFDEILNIPTTHGSGFEKHRSQCPRDQNKLVLKKTAKNNAGQTSHVKNLKKLVFKKQPYRPWKNKPCRQNQKQSV